MAEGAPAELKRECVALTAERLLEIGRRLELAELPLWDLTARSVDRLVTAHRAFPETLNYRDFHHTNLALSREPGRAIVFDYHETGLGPAWCDLRNARGGFGERARRAFLATYGPLDERVAVLDDALAPLFTLIQASRLPPGSPWRERMLAPVRNGDLERALRRAVESL